MFTLVTLQMERWTSSDILVLSLSLLDLDAGVLWV